MNESRNDLGEALILIVDDEPDSRDWLSRDLNQQGYRVSTASCGEEALEMLRSGLWPDLILLDIKMPGMDGYSVCETLKAQPSTCKIPIIFISALGTTDSIVKGFEVGGADYVTRPFQAPEILARLRTQLSLRLLTQKLEELVQIRTMELAEAYARLQETEKARQKLIALILEGTPDVSVPSALVAAIRSASQASSESFSLWLSSQMSEKGWSMRALANRMGYNHSTVSRVMSGEISPSQDFCDSLATALGDVLVSEVLIRAGLAGVLAKR